MPREAAEQKGIELSDSSAGLGETTPQLNDVAVSTGSADVPATKADIPPLRFLVVDDNEDIRELLVRMIERLGHTARTADDGVDAVELLALESFDFMLLDLTMPRMSGEDVVRCSSRTRTAALGCGWSSSRTAAAAGDSGRAHRRKRSS